MIRAIRPQAIAQDDAALISGWNLSPNIAYTIQLNPGSSACGVLLCDEGQTTIIASGAGLVGTDQQVILHPYTGQTIGMVDADLGWHLLLTTTGTESPRIIRIGPAVDLPDEIHPIYADDDLAVARATAGVDDHAHYVDDVTVTCPLGFGAWIGDVARTPVDGTAVDGQAESIIWTGSPNGASDAVVIRRHVAIAPEPFVEITPPTVADDTGTATHLVGTSGNILTNDEDVLVVTAVNGLSANVGVQVAGSNGGKFTVQTTGVWTFAPDGDFDILSGSETSNTSITYHASNGIAEALATLTVTVSHANAAPVAVDDVYTTDALTTTNGNVLLNDTDADGDTLTVSKVNGLSGNVGVPVTGSGGGLFTIGSTGAWTFAPHGDFASLTGAQTATTSVAYHVSDGVAEDDGILIITVSAAASPWAPTDVTTALYCNINGATSGASISDLSGNSRVAAQGTVSKQPAIVAAGLNGHKILSFDGVDDVLYIASNFIAEQPLYIFAVVKCYSEYGGIITSRSSSTDASPGLLINNSAKIEMHGESTSGTKVAVSPAANTGWTMVCGKLEASKAYLSVNGGDFVAAASTFGAFSGTTSNTAIGTYRNTDGNYGKFDLAALVVLTSSTPQSVIDKLFGWAAHEFGLTADLPVGHPYKSAPPIV